ncbi:hypothetical protein GCM10027034_39780 [Ramlibacter solisilvae]|uniref:methyltransferase domain-containing protein n=1 Tax=Ramlibacter tataouinensis TaxID=94132 RepID=UPI000777050D|nr:class I SAM-dependent methyltransferase [Ramlibacter tataouinensis]
MTAAQGRLADIARHYDRKVLAFGATALGIDWPTLSSVHARLLTLLEAGDLGAGARLNDLGCGWGAALEVIDHLLPAAPIDYLGIDVAPAMVRTARTRWAKRPRTRFAVGASCPRVADYSIASGIFNVKLSHPAADWEQHVREVLTDMHRHSAGGFGANFMLPTVATRSVPELYCTEPEPWVRFCEQLPGRAVRVAPVPGLSEFTLLVN